MKTTTRLQLLLATTPFLAPISSLAQSDSNVRFEFGSVATISAYAFLDSTGSPLVNGEDLVVLGYFSTTPTTFSPSLAVFDDFIPLAETTSFGGSGFFSGAATVDILPLIPSPVGLRPWLAVFDGITTVSDIALASSFGLFSDSSYGPIPTGTETPSPATTFNIRTETLDTIAIGSEVADGGPGTGVGYQLASPIPEPSAIQLFALGSLGFLLRRRRR